MMPNAGAHLLPEAGAERTLEAVRCSAMFGLASVPNVLPELNNAIIRAMFDVPYMK
jgi:hypothetical protein